MNTDLIIIGSGPGGYRTAAYAASKGLGVTVIESGNLGGTCLNTGCIPTKALARNAELLLELAHADAFGINNATYDFDFEVAAHRKDGVVEQLRSGVETLLSSPGINLVRGKAEFVDAHTVKVGEEQYTAKNVIIATGSLPKSLRLNAADPELLCDSDGLLALKKLPKRLCVIGAGVIGMEFASIFNAFGAEVTVVEFLKECLPALDSDIAKRLRKTLEKRGVTFYMQSAVTEVANGRVVFERKGKQAEVETDLALMAVGRRPNVEGLNLEAAGIVAERNGIAVDDNMMTAVEGLYAIGDVNGRQMLAHAATMQGIHAVNHILGKTDEIRFDIMPAAIFTNPEAGCVGLSEDACKEKGIDYKCHRAMYRANGKALAMAETEGLVKVLADAEGKILGCHVYGAHAADLVQEVAALMNRDATIAQLADIVHIHPTLNEMLQDAALG